MQNIAGIISSEAFQSEDAPIYSPALLVSGCFDGGMILMALLAYFYYRNLNKKLDSGELTFVKGMESSPKFRYVL